MKKDFKDCIIRLINKDTVKWYTSEEDSIYHITPY